MSNVHPNATAGLGGGAVGTLAVWLLNKYTKAGLDEVSGAAVASAFTAMALLVGRRGLAGLWEAVRYGSQGKPAK